MAVPRKYGLIVCWSAEDDVLVVDVPELSGCMPHRATSADAVASTQEAIQLWLDTAAAACRAIPEPNGRRLFDASVEDARPLTGVLGAESGHPQCDREPVEVQVGLVQEPGGQRSLSHGVSW